VTVSVTGGDVAPEVVLVPLVAVLVLDDHVGVLRHVGRALDLDVAAGAEGDDLALGELEDELLDEGGDAVVGLDVALPLAHAEDLGVDLDLHVLLDLDLAGQAAALAGLALGDVAELGGVDAAAAALDDDLADAAGALAAAGGGDEDLVAGQGVEQGVAGGHAQRVGGVVVDADRDGLAVDQLGLRGQEDEHEGQDHEREHRHAEDDDGGHGACSSA
jgi:hypothetical protein